MRRGILSICTVTTTYVRSDGWNSNWCTVVWGAIRIGLIQLLQCAIRTKDINHCNEVNERCPMRLRPISKTTLDRNQVVARPETTVCPPANCSSSVSWQSAVSQHCPRNWWLTRMHTGPRWETTAGHGGRGNHTGQPCSTSHHSQPSLLPTPRDRPSLHPIVHALMEICNWSPTQKTSSESATIKENGCYTSKEMWAFSHPFITVTSLLSTQTSKRQTSPVESHGQGEMVEWRKQRKWWKRSKVKSHS